MAKARGLMTIPQTYDVALEYLSSVLQTIDDPEVRENLLATAEYMRSIVEAQAILEQMMEATMSNFQMAVNQRDFALATIQLWKDNGVKQTLQTAGDYISEDVMPGARSEDVQVALKRLLGFDIGAMDGAVADRFFEALDQAVRQIEMENEHPDEDADIA